MKIYVYILITCLFGGLLLAEKSFASICDEKETVIFLEMELKQQKKKLVIPEI